MKLITLDTEGRGELKHEQPGYVGRKLYRFFELKRASWSGGCLSLISTTGLDQTTERERLAMQVFGEVCFFEACCGVAGRGGGVFISFWGGLNNEAPVFANPFVFFLAVGRNEPKFRAAHYSTVDQPLPR